MAILAWRNDERIADLTANDEALAKFSWGVRAGLELHHYNGEFKVILQHGSTDHVFDIDGAASLQAALTEALYIVRAMQDTDE